MGTSHSPVQGRCSHADLPWPPSAKCLRRPGHSRTRPDLGLEDHQCCLRDIKSSLHPNIMTRTTSDDFPAKVCDASCTCWSGWGHTCLLHRRRHLPKTCADLAGLAIALPWSCRTCIAACTSSLWPRSTACNSRSRGDGSRTNTNKVPLLPRDSRNWPSGER